MRRTFYIIACFILPALAACSNKLDISDIESRPVITLEAYSTLPTKGYVEGIQLEDTPVSGLHSDISRAPRTIYLTAWLHGQTGTESEYFRNIPFMKNANGESDGYWHHNEPVYWPFSGTLDFLAYSSTGAIPESSVEWGRGNSTDKLTLYIDKTHTQDDVLFSSVSGKSLESSIEPTVSMEFKHSQAWIQIRLLATTPLSENIVQIERFVIKDIYTSGVVTITHPFGFAEAEWNYRYNVREDTVMDDPNGVYGTLVTTETSYLDMLLPEQQKKNILMYYKLAGSDTELVYEFPFYGSYWNMGKKYIYTVNFEPTQITVSASVSGWAPESAAEIEIPES